MPSVLSSHSMLDRFLSEHPVCLMSLLSRQVVVNTQAIIAFVGL